MLRVWLGNWRKNNSLKLPCEIFRYNDFEIAQNNDDSVKTYAELHKDTIEIHNNIICDTSNNQLRPIVPSKYKQTIFNLLHNISHPGIKATRKLITARFTWININKDCTEWARTCVSCQKSKVQVHMKAPLNTFNTPARRFDNIHVDIVGPLPKSQEKQYLFTIIDRFTRWPDAIRMKDMTTSSCCNTLLI